MSFTDLMSSGRGPGVIGTLLALLVLLGFGVLYVFVFNEDLQGGERTIESVLKSQATEIASYKEQVARDTEQLQLVPEREAAEADLKIANQALRLATGEIVGLRAVIERLNTEIGKSGEEFEAYKEEYRTFSRREAAGRKLEALETKAGKTYSNVEIREVDAVGVLIRHDDGQLRIPFEDLPEEMQDHFQFDPSKREDAMAQEAALRAEMEKAVAAANLAAGEQLAEHREKERERIRQENLRLIALKEQQLSAARSAVTDLEQEKIAADQAAAAARAAGKQFINRSGAIVNSINQKKREISTLTAEIARLKSNL